MRTVFRVAMIVVGTLIVVEVCGRFYLTFWAPKERFMRYATTEQILDKYPLRFIQDRHLGLVPAPGFISGFDRHNRFGFRGNEINRTKPDSVYRIVCIGGSTTYSTGVSDYRLAHPSLLQEYLRRKTKRAIEVVNAGIPGASSLESLINLVTRVMDVEPNMIIVCDGINDVHTRMVWPPEAYKADQSGYATPPVFHSASILEVSLIYRVIMIKAGRLVPANSFHRVMTLPATYVGMEYIRQIADGSYPAGLFRTTPVDEILQVNQPIFLERNLSAMVDIAGSRGIEVVFTTSPFCTDFPKQIFGAPEDSYGLEEHNELVKGVASRKNVRFYDLAKFMPQQKRFFTDAIHLQSIGEGIRAKLIGDYLLTTGLIGKALQ